MDLRIMHVQIITLDEVKIYQLKLILLEMTEDHLCLFPSLFLKYISLEPDIISLKKPDMDHTLTLGANTLGANKRFIF